MNKYKVYVSKYHKVFADATTAEKARHKAWNSVKNRYTYGYENWTEFSKVKVERVD